MTEASRIRNAAPAKLVSGIAKFQRAVRKLIPQKRDMAFYIRQAILHHKLKKIRKHDPLRLQKLIRKHLFGAKRNKFDLTYIVKVVTMLETLQVIFRTFGANLGEKYKKIADNVWSNEFNEKV